MITIIIIRIIIIIIITIMSGPACIQAATAMTI